jgi:hypothetical protein
LYAIWKTAANWQINLAEWLKTPFTQINADKMNNFIHEAFRTVSKGLKLVTHKAAPSTVGNELKKRIETMKGIMPFIIKLRHPGIRTRHWNMILREIGAEELHQEQESFTLAYVLDLHLENHPDITINVTDFARNEHTIETALDKMLHDLRAYSLKLAPYKDTKTFIVSKKRLRLL